MAKSTKRECPRCGGWTYLEKDRDTWYWHCLMCGCAMEIETEKYKYQSGRKYQYSRG